MPANLTVFQVHTNRGLLWQYAIVGFDWHRCTEVEV